MLHHGEQLVDGVRPEGVEHVGAVEGDAHRAVRLGAVVGQVGESLEAGDLVPLLGVEDVGHAVDRAHGRQPSGGGRAEGNPVLWWA